MSTVTPLLNLVKPASTELFSLATYNNNLDILDTKFGTFPKKVYGDNLTIAIGAGASSATVTVNLPAGFTSAPTVVATLSSNVAANASKLQIYAYSITTTNFVLKMQTSDNAAIGVGYNIAVQWIAVQP